MTDRSQELAELEALRVAMYERCELLERELLRAKMVILAAIDAQRPGAAENPDESSLGWLTFLRWLERTHAAGVRHEGPAPTRSDDDFQAAMVAAMAETPEPVACSDGITRFVYPKSYHAFCFLKSLDAELGQLRAEWIYAEQLAETAQDLGLADPTTSLRMLAPLMESRAVRLWLWILSHRGPGLPFDEDRPLPGLPKWTQGLAPQDLLLFLRAHVKVNGTRLKIIASSFPPDPAAGGSRLTTADFIGAVTSENEPGAARRLIRATSLGQLYAGKIAAARSHKEAMDRAKRDRPSGAS